jgi:hypothetical protein
VVVCFLSPRLLRIVTRRSCYTACDIARGDKDGDTFLDGPDIQAFVAELLAP